MEWIYQWIRNLAYFFVFLSAAMNFLPDGEEKKYIRFFMGMLLILVLLKPFLQIRNVEQTLERRVLADSIAESFSEMLRESGKQEVTGSDYVEKACAREMEGQIEQLAASFSLKLLDCEIQFFDGDVPKLKSVRLKLQKTEPGDSSENGEELLKNELKEVYNIPEGNINISIQE